jgi:hypothetical protein
MRFQLRLVLCDANLDDGVYAMLGQKVTPNERLGEARPFGQQAAARGAHSPKDTLCRRVTPQAT